MMGVILYNEAGQWPAFFGVGRTQDTYILQFKNDLYGNNILKANDILINVLRLIGWEA